MFSRIKVGVLITFVTVLTGFIFCNKSSAKIVNNPQQYIEYLTEKSKSEPEVSKVIEKFRGLSQEKQRKFVGYLNDPAILKTAFGSEGCCAQKEIYGGDVVITHIVEGEKAPTFEEHSNRKKSTLAVMTNFIFPPIEAAPNKKQFSVQDTRSVKIYGITVSTFTAWLKYEATGSNVTNIIAGGGYYSHLLPASTVSQQSCSKYIYGNKAHTAMIWNVTISLPAIPWSPTGTVHHHVLGFANGSKTYRFWRMI